MYNGFIAVALGIVSNLIMSILSGNKGIETTLTSKHDILRMLETKFHRNMEECS
jgi:hypothetical protein